MKNSVAPALCVNASKTTYCLRGFSIFAALVLAGCTWDPKARDDTLSHFRNRIEEYEAVIRDLKYNSGVDLVKSQSVFPEGIEVTSMQPPVVEFTPINFYYVIVFAPDEALLNASNAIKDEGRVLKKMGGGWYLVQRGMN